MNIKEFLKLNGIKKIDLSKDLELSRPTLDQYIEIFECGKEIENERYNIIFKRLFSNLDIDRYEFDKRLMSVKYLLNRDKKYDIGELAPEAADLIADIHNKMVRDMEEQWNSKVYEFILILLNNYKKNEIMNMLAGYFTDLNTDFDSSKWSNTEKAYYAYYYQCFRKIHLQAPELDEEAFSSFLKRKEELKSEREKRKEEKFQSVQNRMQDAISALKEEYGKNESELSERELMEAIIKRLGKM